MLPTLLVSCYQSNLQDEVEGFRRVWVISKSSLGDRDKAVSEHLLATKENNVLPNEESVSLNFIPPAGQ